MVIIFTGIDGSGKSSLVSEVSRQLEIPKIKLVNPQDIMNMDKIESKILWDSYNKIQYKILLDVIEQSACNMIIDRFHIDDMVYSVCFGRTIDRNFMREIDDRLVKLNSVIFYVWAKYQAIYSRRNINRKDYDIQTNWFFEMLSFSKIKKYWINGTDSIESNCSKIIEKVKSNE